MNRMLKFIHKKTGTILNMSILLALILFVGFLYGTLYENYCGDILSRELTRLLTIARSNATYMQFYYQDLHEDCRAFLEDNEFSMLLASGSQGAQEEIRGDLNRFFSLHSDDYLYAAVMDGGGEILCSAGIEQESIPPEILSMPFGNGVYERGFWMDADTYAFAYCSRIYQERELVGALIGVLDFSAVARRLFRYVRIGKKGNLSVCDAEGIVLLHSDKQMLGKKIYAGGARDDAQTEEDVLYIEEALAKKERGKAVFSVEESGKTEQMLMAFSRANIAPSYYMVVATLPYSEAISGIQSTVRQAVATFVLLMSVLILLLLLLFYQFRRYALNQAEQRHLTELNHMLLDMKNRQDQLHQKENLQAVGVFASGIAHEFSNLLTPIMAYCEMLMLEYHTNARLYESLFEIYQSASSSRALARQLLSFSRSSKPGEGVQTPLSVNELLKNCVRSMDIQVSGNIRIDMQLPEDALFVMGNPSMLQQAVNNLLVNACQSMENGGTLTVRCERVPAQEMVQTASADDLPFIGDGVKITIEDTGTGMDPQTMEQIFKPFFTTKKNTTGTGLGLMIVQNVINRHDGFIDVASEPGKGSRFIVVLPECIRVERGREETQQSRILLCHAPKSGNMPLYRRLQEEGEPILFCTDPLEAIRSFTAHPDSYSLLVTEYALDHFSGIALSRTFRRLDASFPVILMTSLIHPDEMVFDPVSAPNEVVLNSVTYAQFRASISKWKKRMGGRPA